MASIYSTARGLTPQQYQDQINTPAPQQVRNDPARDWANKYFGTQKYKGAAQTAPYNIYGGHEVLSPMPNMSAGLGSTVHGQNIQPDIPNDLPQGTQLDNTGTPVPGSAPAPETLPLQQAVDYTGQDMAPAGWKYDKAPEMPKDPTNGQKTYTPEHVNAGSQAITFGMQNNLPPAASPVQAQTQAADHDKLQQDLASIASAKNPKTAWQDVKKDPFYKNSDFYTGLMNVGLAIMSGANPMQAFQAGQGAMDKATMSTQLSGNKQALIDQGYSPASVEAAITSGDTSKLQMQQMSDQDRMDAETQKWAAQQQYQTDLNNQNQQRENAEWDRRNAITNQQSRDAANETFNRQKSLIDTRAASGLETFKSKEELKAAQAAESAAAGNWQPSRTQLSNEKAQWAPYVQKFGTRATNFATAEHAIDVGSSTDDTNTANANFKIASEQATQALVGGLRSISQEDIDDMIGQPGLIQRKGNQIIMSAGFKPTAQTWDFLRKVVEADKAATLAPLHDRMVQRGQQLINSGYTPAQARIQINQGANLGVMLKPGELEDSIAPQRTASSQNGALSSANTGADLNGF